MKKFTIFLLLMIVLLFSANAQTTHLLIPAVKQAIEKEGCSSILFSKPLIEVDSFADKEAFWAAQWLSQYSSSKVEAKSQKTFSDKGTIQFLLINEPTQKSLGEYRIQIAPEKILVESNSKEGFFNATATLIQCYQLNQKKRTVENVEIFDFPDFPVRGFMHDVGRNFQTIKKLKENIDIFACYKLNYFHWHLTDNPAWRIESKIYPQLNDPENHRPLRNAGAFYTFDEIRDLFNYAKSKGIQIIPEIDMPGHSKYFNRTFGTAMNSLRGMKILEELIDEFCAEIPKEMAPIIHIGSDEVKIINKKAFMSKMTQAVRKHHREVMVWHPGLESDPNTILQIWGKNNYTRGRKSIDSSSFYVANFDPLLSLKELAFTEIAYKDFSSDQPLEKINKIDLGAISCIWNDVRVSHEDEIYINNPVYSATIMLAQRAWNNRNTGFVGTPDFSPEKIKTMVKKSYGKDADPFIIYAATELMIRDAKRESAFEYYQQLEKRFKAHRDAIFTPAKIPFFFLEQQSVQWKYSKPNPRLSEADLKKLTTNAEFYMEKTADWGITIGMISCLKSRLREIGLFANAAVGTQVVLTTRIYSPKDQEVSLLAGFDVPLRANRQYGGIPTQGKWSADDSTIYLNGEKVAPPVWENPGKYVHPHFPTWHKPEEEIPWTKEEFYWSRKPVSIQLKSGWNTVSISTKLGYENQFWVAAFIPLSKGSCSEKQINPEEVPGLEYAP